MDDSNVDEDNYEIDINIKKIYENLKEKYDRNHVKLYEMNNNYDDDEKKVFKYKKMEIPIIIYDSKLKKEKMLFNFKLVLKKIKNIKKSFNDIIKIFKIIESKNDIEGYKLISEYVINYE